MTPSDPAEDPSPDEPPLTDGGKDAHALAPHRIAFHVLVVGLCGGLFGGVAMIASQLLRASAFQSRSVFVMPLVAIVWCGLLGGSVQIARRARPALRWLVLIVVGATAALVMTAALVGVEGLVSDGPMEAWMRVIGFFGELFQASGRAAQRALGVGLGTLFPFAALGIARAGFGEKPCRAWVQGLAAVFGSLAGVAVFVEVLRLRPLYALALIGGGGVGSALGMAAGDVLEQLLLRRIEAYRNK
jgi:hypothetical protein